MGGAEDMPQRSSSPLKRPASELEPDLPLSSQKEDVDMVMVPNAQEDPESTIAAPTAIRAASVNMMRDEVAGDDSAESAPAAENGPVPDPSTDIPSIDFQVSTVTTLCRTEGEKQLKEGNSTYLVSKKWLERVTSRTSEAKAKSKETLSDQDIGPIDNSNIIQRIIPQPGREDFVQLKHGIGEDFFELFPVDAWNMVFDWYGLKENEKPILRFAHNTNPDKTPDAIPNVTYEYHPPVFQIHRVWSELGNKVDASTKSANPDAPIIVASRSMRMHDFLKIIKEAAGVPLKQKIRLWRVPRTLPAAEPALSTTVGNATPPSSRPGTPPTANTDVTSSEVQDSWKKLLLDVTEFTKVERDSGRIKVEFEDSTVNDNYNGRSDLDFCGLGDDQALVIDELVEGKDGYVSNTKPSQNGKLNGTGRKGNSSFIVSSQNNSGRNSPAPSSGYNLRSSNRRSKNGRPPGTVGLSNLGNTCYMNSALQCVRSVEELTKYFLSDSYDPELNRDNPLGHGGAVAESYANLLKEIYKEPAPVSVQPRYFKNIVGRYATQFSGYGQQDSQEFIGFLLDGLQEDLSRVKKKPYIEKPDSTDEMIGNPDAIREMATKVWDITKQRDDSVIADLFTGMYKSTLVCPECDKVSITFDPFNNMTLQLPIANLWNHSATFFPLNDKPIIVMIEMDKHASIRTLKTQISQKVGVPLERLFACEVWSKKFFRWHFDQETASDVIQPNDLLHVYELEAVPTNLPSPAKSKGNTFGGNNSDEPEHVHWDSSAAEKLLVPVFYRRRTREKWSSKKGSWELTTVPHFVVLTPQEARSEEAIKRKILEKVVTFTTSSIITDEDDPSSASESIDPDLVVTTGSDADSSGDSKFVAQSLDGEDEIVDVAMKDSNTVRKSVENRPTAPLKIFNTSRPKWVDPAEFLSGELQNLFEISYFTDKQGRLPLHWDDKLGDPTFKKISERNPQVQQMNSDDTSCGFDLVDGSAGSVSSKSSRDSSDDINSFELPPTRMNEESSDDDLNPTSPPKALPVRPAAPKSGGKALGKNKRRSRHQATYTKKGKAAPLKRQEIEADDEQEAPDDGPLVRPGEGLVVDWNEDAWDNLFGGSIDKNNGHGCSTYQNPPTLRDPDLLSTRKTRDSKKHTGIPLDDCLDEFGKEEILSEMDTWYCPRCKEHRRASKKFEIWRTPDILIMHLKRFSSTGYRRDKVDALVKFPIEGLDLSSRVVEKQDGKEEIYDLIAIDDHWGGLGGGHYTAFAKNFVDGRWWSYNDASVDLVKNPSSMITASAYLLFYRRRSSEPLGGTVMQEIVRTFDNTLSSDEEESGEGRRLGGNSSQPGSPSALTGVGAAHRQPDHPGSEDGVVTMTANQPDLESAPPYSDHNQGGEPIFESLHPFPPHYSSIRESTEADEAIDMSMSGNDALNATQPIWGWDGLNQNPGTFPSGTGSEAGEAGSVADFSDGDSNGVLHGSEPSRASMERRKEEFESSRVDDEFQEEYIPDAVHDAPDAIQVMEYNRQRNYDLVSHVQQDEIEEPAAEIHLEEGEEVKID